MKKLKLIIIGLCAFCTTVSAQSVEVAGDVVRLQKNVNRTFSRLDTVFEKAYVTLWGSLDPDYSDQATIDHANAVLSYFTPEEQRELFAMSAAVQVLLSYKERLGEIGVTPEVTNYYLAINALLESQGGALPEGVMINAPDGSIILNTIEITEEVEEPEEE